MNSTGQKCFYDLLGVLPDASAAELRDGYLRAAQQSHPDLNHGSKDAEQIFKQAQRVYELLRDPVQRANYDEDPSRFTLTDSGIHFSSSKTIVSRPYTDPVSEDRRWADADATVSTRPSNAKLHPTPRRNSRWIPANGAAAPLIAITILSALLATTGLNVYWRQLEHGDANVTPPTTVRNNSAEFESAVPDYELASANRRQVKQANAKKAEQADQDESLAELPSIPRLKVVDELNAALPGSPPLTSMPLQAGVTMDLTGASEPIMDEPVFAPSPQNALVPTLPQPLLDDQSFLPTTVNHDAAVLPITPALESPIDSLSPLDSFSNAPQPTTLPPPAIPASSMSLPAHRGTFHGGHQPDAHRMVDPQWQQATAQTRLFGIYQTSVMPSGVMGRQPSRPVANFPTAMPTAPQQLGMPGQPPAIYPGGAAGHAHQSARGLSGMRRPTMGATINRDPGSQYALKNSYQPAQRVEQTYSGGTGSPDRVRIAPRTSFPSVKSALSPGAGWNQRPATGTSYFGQ